MSLDTQSKAFLDNMAASGAPPLYELSVEQARQALADITRQMDVPAEPVGRRAETAIPGPDGPIPIRIYSPDADTGARARPMVMLYHGGGFALGGLDTHENVARHICRHAGAVVISVAYRLAPEHKFPAGMEDSYAALCWAAEHAGEIGGDSARIAVMGDSAGGNISAVVSQLAAVRGGPDIARQVLIYPAVNLDPGADYPSRRDFGGGDYFLSAADVDWITGMYFNDAENEVRDLRASPILAEDLAGLPPALVVTAGYDMLRDEGKHYADRLRDAGVDVEYKCFEGTIHGFMSFGGAIPAGRECLDRVVSYLGGSAPPTASPPYTEPHGSQ